MGAENPFVRDAAHAYQQGEFRKTLRITRRGLMKSPQDINLKKLAADAHHALGNPSEAKTLYAWLLEQGPDDVGYHFGYANACYLKNELDAAREHFEFVLRSDSQMLAARALLAHVYLKQKETALAECMLREGLKLAVTPETAKARAILLGVKAMVECGNKDAKAARTSLVEAIRLSPANLTLLEQLADLNERAGNSCRGYCLGVQGRGGFVPFQEGAEVVWHGGGLVAADSKEEALRYLLEVLPADLTEVKIVSSEIQTRKVAGCKGVRMLSPSFSYEIALQPASRFLQTVSNGIH